MVAAGIILHSISEHQAHIIYYSQFFSPEWNDENRVIREQAVAAQVAKEFGFRALCSVYSQVHISSQRYDINVNIYYTQK